MEDKVQVDETLAEVEREIEKVDDTEKSIELRQKQMELKQQKIKMENADQREDAQRRMAWFSLGGMLIYPLMIVLATVSGLDNAAKILGDMAPTYFVSVAAIIMAFYGKEAYLSKK